MTETPKQEKTQAAGAASDCNDLLGDESLALARWLAQAYQELDECRYAAIALPAEQCKDHLIMRCPVIQGTGNQIALARFADGTVDKDALARAFGKLKASPNAQAQPAERSEARLQRNVVREDKR